MKRYQSIFKDENNSIFENSTGSTSVEKTKLISYPIDKFIVKVILTENDKFVGIEEISINKEFLDLKQKISSYNIHDVEEFYEED